tara:strand:+ start:2071 stop:2346 length:276 start_codon:yes stop_codon:yes gene_type:complete
MNQFSKNLNKIIKEKKITLQELSVKTGVPKSTIHRYSTGNKTIKIEQLQKIKRFLNVSTDELLFSEKTNVELLKETVDDFKLKQIKAIIES